MILKNSVLSNIFLIFFVFMFFTLAVYAYSYASAPELTPVQQKVEKEFLSVFPKTTHIQTVKETPIKGLWAIIFSNKLPGIHNVIYFYPEKKLIFFGEIWDKDGKVMDFSN